MVEDRHPDLDRVWTVRDFGAALVAVLAPLTTREVEGRTAALERGARAARPVGDLDVVTVSRTKASEYRRGKDLPDERALAAMLSIAGVLAEGERARWFAVRDRIASPRRPAGAVLITDADPRLLGVHKAIAADPATDPGDRDRAFLPAYVERDFDRADDPAPSGLRAAITAAMERGGFVLLVGGSSVGKTRSAYEAVRALASDWWLLRPGAAGVLQALAAAPVPRTVIWLDELQRHLGPSGASAAVIGSLLAADEPVVVVGTLWPGRYEEYTRQPADGGPDPHGDARALLALADVVPVGAAFSPGEQARSRTAAETDRRIARSLTITGYSLPQVLAAAPELIARWDTAQLHPYRRAVLTAAVDLTRVGVSAPLTADMLHAAAVDHCTPHERTRAPGDWFDDALAFATQPQRGGAAVLEPTGTGDMGEITGYLIADYLQQHGEGQRLGQYVPLSVWNAVLAHCDDPRSLDRVAETAGRDKLHRLETDLRLRQSPNNVDARRLADLLAQQGRIQELRARAGAGDPAAEYRLADLLVELSGLEELRALTAAGEWVPAGRLADLLAEQGEIEELRARADAGDLAAEGRLADLLAEQGEIDELRARAAGGDRPAADRLARLLAEQGHVDQAIGLLQARVDAGDEGAADLLAYVLDDHGRIEELTAHADAGSFAARELLAFLTLEQRGGMDELRTRADAGGWMAADRLADLLANQGRVEELRARAEAGDWIALHRLADLLAEQGHTHEAISLLQTSTYTNAPWLANQLADLLAELGRADEAIILLRPGADAGEEAPARRLADLLVAQGRDDELRVRAKLGDPFAAQSLKQDNN